MKTLTFIILLIITLLGLFLRTYKLGEIPNGFYVDEAAIAYNAYSLLETGRDEYGKAFPIFLRSYGTFPSPLYAYLTIISFDYLDLSVFSTRILSAVSGTLTIVFVYLIFQKLNIFKNKYFPLVTSFIFATAPWSIHFSRGAFESNLALLIFSAAIYLLLLSLNNQKFLILASIFLGISTYAYQSERLIALLVLVGFFVIYKINTFNKDALKEFLKSKKMIFISLGLFFLIQVPQFMLINQTAFSKRATGLFYDEAVSSQSEKLSTFLPVISYPLALVREFLSQYLVYFSPRSLFYLPDEDLQRAIPELSTFYPWLVIPYLIGVYFLIKRIKEKNIQFVILLLLSSPIPAALTKDPFSTLRALPMILPLVGIITLGIDHLYSKFRLATIFVLSLLIIFSGIIFWRSYFVLLPHERALNWNYGYKQLAEVIKSRPQDHFVIDQSRTNPAYLILAFYLKTPPEEIQKAANPTIIDRYYSDDTFDQEYKYANLETRYIQWETDIYKKQILVGDTLAVSKEQAEEHELTPVFVINDTYLKPLFIGWQTNPDQKCAKLAIKNELCNN